MTLQEKINSLKEQLKELNCDVTIRENEQKEFIYILAKQGIFSVDARFSYKKFSELPNDGFVSWVKKSLYELKYNYDHRANNFDHLNN